MKNAHCYAIAFFLCLASATVAAAQETSPRQIIIAKEMDCVSSQLKAGAINWQDICSMPERSSRPVNRSRTQAVTRQLDAVETQRHPSDEVIQGPVGSSQEPGAGQMFKDLLNPQAEGFPHADHHRKTPVQTLDISSEIFYYHYEEPDFAKVSGPMYGYSADYAYRPTSGWLNNALINSYFLQGRYATSRNLTYQGSGEVKNKHDDSYEFRALIGRDYALKDALVTPYFGFGFRYLFDQGNGRVSSTGKIGYDRKSHYFYLPFGGTAEINMAAGWKASLNAEYDVFLSGWQESYLSDGDQFGHDAPNIHNHQDSGYGIRGSVKILKQGRSVDFFVEPFIRFWNINDSKSEYVVVDGKAGYGVEPQNTTLEIGSKVGLQF